MPDERKSFNQIVEFRKEKLEKLIAKGVDPYPPLYNPSHMSYEIISNFDSMEHNSVCVAGRIISIRKMGKASFFNIQDSKGKIQIFILEELLSIQKGYACRISL